MSEFESQEVASRSEGSNSISERERVIRDTLEAMTEAIELCPATHRIDETPLPSLPKIGEALDNILAITSLGYGRYQNVKRSDAPFLMGGLIGDVIDALSAEGIHDLRSNRKMKGRSLSELRVESKRLTHAFIETLPSLIEHLERDVVAAYRNDPAAKSLELILLCYPGVQAVRIYRIANTLHKLGLEKIARMMSEIAHARTGIDIHPGATIGHSLFIDHGTGVTIGETSEIGDEVVLYQGTTIGAQKFNRDVQGYVRHDEIKRHPTIGNRVKIYANATILGGDTTVGDDCIVGANCWIEDSIPPRTLVTLEKPNQRFIEVAARSTSQAKLRPAQAMTEETRYELFLDSINRCDDN